MDHWQGEYSPLVLRRETLSNFVSDCYESLTGHSTISLTNSIVMPWSSVSTASSITVPGSRHNYMGLSGSTGVLNSEQILL